MTRDIVGENQTLPEYHDGNTNLHRKSQEIASLLEMYSQEKIRGHELIERYVRPLEPMLNLSIDQNSIQISKVVLDTQQQHINKEQVEDLIELSIKLHPTYAYPIGHEMFSLEEKGLYYLLVYLKETYGYTLTVNIKDIMTGNLPQQYILKTLIDKKIIVITGLPDDHHTPYTEKKKNLKADPTSEESDDTSTKIYYHPEDTYQHLNEGGRSDMLLINDCLSDKYGSRDTLFNKYRQSLYRVIFKKCKNHEDTEDIILETFTKVYQKLSSYRPMYAFSTWLFRIAINISIDKFRKEEKSPIGESIDTTIITKEGTLGNMTFKDGILDEQDTLLEVSSQELYEYMQHIKNRLPQKYRNVLHLRYFEELSYDEIAETLDIPLGTVKAQLYRAKKEFLKQVKRHPDLASKTVVKKTIRRKVKKLTNIS